ncbi:MAG TPA: TldD/PmbA family protein [Pseudonocardiaceae bacterium]|jgi:predicted Zn-dependent protease|nr:TldD/PmbA family protein [Pseudonocardiaceae bacterium]
MSIDQDTVTTALDILGPGTRIDVSREETGLLRYAHSRVTAQHSERRFRARVRVTRDGRTVTGVLETLDPQAVRDLRERLDRALASLPACPPVGRPAPQPANGVTPAASSAPRPSAPRPSAAGRHDWFDTVRNGLAGDVSLGGSIRDDVVDRAVADSDGLFRSETLTKASIQAIAERDGRSVSSVSLHRDASRIPVDGIAERLMAELAPLPVRDRAAGPVRVVLRPQAALNLLATYGYAALGAAGYARGTSAAAGRMGQQVVSELLTVVDDGHDPDGLPSTFDAEGVVRCRTPLIENGTLTGVVSNLEFAGVTGGASTGHGVPFGWRFGALPAPSHMLMAAGDATEEELLAECGEGLLVSKLNYLRVLHPKDTLVTGSTRDGTYWVRDGKVVAVHPPVRFTFRMDDALRAVVAVGRERERGETPFMESVVAPALLVGAGPFVL